MDKGAQNSLAELEEKVRAFVPDPEHPDDAFIIIALQEAIAAAKEGKFAVGAALVRENGEIVERGHNRVFSPHFRSDLHAEMDVMTRFEERFREIDKMKGFTLYTSLEPCPMCFARLITSGVGKVYYASADERGGMVHRLEHMPPAWTGLAERQEFAKARCSPELSDLALQIFLTTAAENNRKLQER
ncbi:MAG: nucleoside deaminase [Candidatus Zixiibacteriota bacterium]|nr:MAG: nucleoside deaminase [candidate division Zixibacteria bacterium]